jgi:hypothetical protein
MIDYMGQVKAYRAKEERLQLIAERKASAQEAWSRWRQENMTTDLMPSPVDILKWAPVGALIDLPSEEAVRCLRFARLFQEKLASFVRTWRDEQLRAVARECDYEDMPQMWINPPATLQLAVCVFTCRGTIHQEAPEYNPKEYTLMWHPEFLHHPCNSICRIYHDREVEEDKVLDGNANLKVSHLFEGCRRKSWTHDKLLFSERASRTVRNILMACKLDHKSTTVHALDKLDPRLVCLKCSFGAKTDGERRFPIWSWREAVSFIDHHRYSGCL